ncbi:DUF1616 domain-containing protein [Natrinema thermotolerans]|uniref:DUF1616 domain-containing protein n=1 Tax=Natrinema thermotolerans TaxID=121872 RepID=A0AAF0P7W3_9EURY|nr:DUF1616 domain-containing protein [Natrinema thermotolerans]QCC59978.1 DUF1616 domain-containing protein [Natrinema thermotolerans]WMT06983.1 DUF1616 domain-containing protein [Natrinema thermotolerans]
MKGLPFQPVTALRRRSKSVLAGAPIDLIGIAGFVLVAAVLLTIVDAPSTVLRAAVGFPLLFLAPGYVVLSALFPRETPAIADGRPLLRQTVSLSDTERAALSFGLSFALLPPLGLVIAVTPFGFTTSTVVNTVAGATLLGAGVAIARRLAVPPADRYRPARRLEAARAAIFDARSTRHVAVNVVLVISMLLAVTTVGYALVAPQDGEQYTSLRLLTEDDTGELVASGYPSEIEAGEAVPLVIAVENQEGEDEDYTAVVQEQRLEDGEIVERNELQRIDYSVNAGGTAYADRTLSPEAEAESIRITVLLYDGDVPETPTTENAYRHGYFWVDVTDGE